MALPRPAGAVRIWGDFQNLADGGNVKAYARDLGALLGSGTAHTGRGLGFPGFDVGVHYAHQFQPSKGNTILSGSGIDGFGLPLIQAEIGMPLKFDGFIRGFSYQGLSVAGGGLRYALLNIEDMPGAPQLMGVWDAESFTHESFSGTHLGLNLVASVRYKAAHTYLTVGGDRTRLSPKDAAADPAIVNQSFIAHGYRASVGVSVRAFPFTYLNAAFAMRNGEPGVQGGAGIRF